MRTRAIPKSWWGRGYSLRAKAPNTRTITGVKLRRKVTETAGR